MFIIVLDGAGVGALPDAASFSDLGSNTLGHVALKRKDLKIANLVAMGLNRVVSLKGTRDTEKTLGAYGKMAELSPGKDTITGHWELAGLILQKPFPLYPQGFPPEIIASFEKLIGRRTLGNIPFSGTEIIKKLGEEHLRTGFPIVYTSADSVFQVAAHEEIVSPETLYEWCSTARQKILVGGNAVGRVIARPFKGEPGNFIRSQGRKDFSLAPPGPTLLDVAKDAGYQVRVIGKVKDIFAGKGITDHLPASDNRSTMEAVSYALREDFKGILWANFIDFDMLYGHRNDVDGFAAALEDFDVFLGNFMKLLKSEDMLLVTADHGCDPTFKGTDHTREYVPLLVFGAKIIPGDLGIRESFADLGATVAEVLGCKGVLHGQSFAGKLFNEEI